MYDKVASFADRQKRLPRCRSNRQEERCLACWLHRCDQEWVVGAQRAALDELLGRFGPDAMRAAEFRRNAISVNSFLELHGRWPRRLRGMGDAAAKEEHRLAQWVKNEGATRTSWKLAVLADFPALSERFKLFSLHVQRQCSDQQLATSCSMDDPGAEDDGGGSADEAARCDATLDAAPKTGEERIRAVEDCPALEAALRGVAAPHLARLDPYAGDRVGPELFVMAQSSAAVADARPPSISWSDCREFLRALPGEGELHTTKAFYSDKGISRMTVDQLISQSQAKNASPTERHQALSVLLRHFETELEARAPAGFDGWGSARNYWYRQKDVLESEGVVREPFRLCCDRAASVRVGLRSDGAPHAPVARVLPERRGTSVRIEESSQTVALIKRERAMRQASGDGSGCPHGFRLLALAADFLCAPCEEEFRSLDVLALSDDDAAEWCARMQCPMPGKEPSGMRRHLQGEQSRLLRRSSALRCAMRALRSDAAHRVEFETFQKELRLEVFERTIAEEGMDKRLRGTLMPTEFRVSSNESKWSTRRFGVDRSQKDRRWWSDALPMKTAPQDQGDYTGKPRYCSARLWHLRAWAVALGGFSRVAPELQEELMLLERDVDGNSLFVGVQRDDRLKWCHALAMWPGGLPAVNVWMDICGRLLDSSGDSSRASPLCDRIYNARRGFEKIQSMSTGIRSLHKSHSVSWNRYEGKFGQWTLLGAMNERNLRGAAGHRAVQRELEPVFVRWDSWTSWRWCQEILGSGATTISTEVVGGGMASYVSSDGTSDSDATCAIMDDDSSVETACSPSRCAPDYSTAPETTETLPSIIQDDKVKKISELQKKIRSSINELSISEMEELIALVHGLQ